MSIIFGTLKQRGAIVAKSELLDLGGPTERYATGQSALSVTGRLGMGFQPYVSHARSEMESQPARDHLGHVLVFDGRLDNYQDLANQLDLNSNKTPDSSIVLCAFARWGADCFSRLTGDWALALWSTREQELYFARDHAGTRTLYFKKDQEQVSWSSHLDALVSSGPAFCAARDYAACYLACRPIRDLTPYEGVKAVPPAHYLVLRDFEFSGHAHWTPADGAATRYRSDSEYETQFLDLFAQSIERRTGAGAPILAELSGGMDSTSIVCMSDHLRRARNPEAELLDTVSYYDDSEITLNERPYFTITEKRRGKEGVHLDTAFSHRTFRPQDHSAGVYLLPGTDSFSLLYEQRFHSAVWREGYRSILSGIGGDEVLGGVPNHLPELADYLMSGNVGNLLKQSFAWSLVDRRPILATLADTAKYATALYRGTDAATGLMPPWLSAPLRERSEEIAIESASHSRRFGIAPSRLENRLVWSSILETLPHLFPQLLSRPEYRYPLLDKDLVNFLFSIPVEQLLRPGRRRSLMRRALVNIVPCEILERRRKAYQLRAPLRTLQQAQPTLEALFRNSVAASLGLIDIDNFRSVLQSTLQGDPQWKRPLMRTIMLEIWLQASRQGSSVPLSSGNVRDLRTSSTVFVQSPTSARA